MISPRPASLRPLEEKRPVLLLLLAYLLRCSPHGPGQETSKGVQKRPV